MNWKISVSGQTIALICVFAFLLARLLLGCDRELPQKPQNSIDTTAEVSVIDGAARPSEPK